MLLHDLVNAHRPHSICVLLSGLSVLLYNLRTIKFGLDRPVELWPLAFVCVSPMIAAQEYHRSFLVSLVTFTICSTLFFWSIGLEWYVGFVTGLMWGVLWDILEFSDLYLFNERFDTSKPTRRATYWTTIVYITSLFLGTFFALSTPLHDAPILIQPISLLGFYALEFTVFTVNAAVGQLVFSQHRKPLFYVPRLSAGPSARVATITPGAELGGVSCDKTVVEQYEKDATCNGTLERQLELTRHAVTVGGAKFVVWPELWLGPFQNLTDAEDYVSSHVGPLAGRLGAFVSVGALVGESGNIAIMVGPEGEILGVYGKQKPLGLVGEKSSLRFGYPTYEIPWTSLVERNRTSPGKVGTLICYDVDFTGPLRSIIMQGAGLILNPSQDWSAVRDHLSQAVFRAVESRVAIAKADMAWDSVIVDPWGRKVARFQSLTERENVLVATVELGNGAPTVATVTGDILPLLCAAYSLFVLVSAGWKWYEVRVARHVYTPDGEYGSLMSA
ncbi:hypothetical protein FOZ62_026185 [Perkinsus olseni]|uniref:CN hydrolase domain-containing protein n=2 Tax=Perkinsus olseni TaxID=32597 RepID=A0A7J6QP11_PEROL|nr:hypothetical protein FOZ62_026185 [Perkinsus olseni]